MGQQTQFLWEVGTGFDLFTSLEVLHDPGRYGLRGNWAAGVRSRIPARKREFLNTVTVKAHLFAVPWLAQLTLPDKDAATVLEALADMPPARRLPALTACYLQEEPRAVLQRAADQGRWSEADQATLGEAYRQLYQREGVKKRVAAEDLAAQLDLWADLETSGTRFLDALEVYYDVFFREDEMRIRPALQHTLASAQALAARRPLAALLETLSQGLSFEEADVGQVQRLYLIPSFWTTPLSLFMPLPGTGRETWLFLFGGRPADVSLVPGEAVPELLYQTLKALADPTRLRILRYLTARPLTPAELARRLRLRPPTVIHHLDALRLARLVQVRLGHDGRRYAARREAVQQACDMLNRYLDETEAGQRPG